MQVDTETIADRGQNEQHPYEDKNAPAFKSCQSQSQPPREQAKRASKSKIETWLSCRLGTVLANLADPLWLGAVILGLSSSIPNISDDGFGS